MAAVPMQCPHFGWHHWPRPVPVTSRSGTLSRCGPTRYFAIWIAAGPGTLLLRNQGLKTIIIMALGA